MFRTIAKRHAMTGPGCTRVSGGGVTEAVIRQMMRDTRGPRVMETYAHLNGEDNEQVPFSVNGIARSEPASRPGDEGKIMCRVWRMHRRRGSAACVAFPLKDSLFFYMVRAACRISRRWWSRE